jgi:hypothetical protein
VSSKAARLRRRQAARRKKYARLRKSGLMPRHTQAERRLAAAERHRQREAEQRRQAWLRRMVVPVVTGVGAAGFVFAAPGISPIRHPVYPHSAASPLYYSYVPMSDSDHPDPPHPAEPDMTFYTNWDGAGTASTGVVIGPVEAASWDGWEWTGSTYGPNVLGD